MKKIIVVVGLCSIGLLGISQNDSTLLKNEVGLNYSPLITVLAGGTSHGMTFEVRYNRHLKKSWFLKSTAGVGLPQVNDFYPFGENQRIKTVNDSTLEVENQLLMERSARFSVGLEYRFMENKNFQIALGNDLFYEYGEINVQVTKNEYILNGGVFERKSEVNLENFEDIYPEHLQSVRNQIGMRPCVSFLYNLNNRWSMRIDVLASVGITQHKSRDWYTGETYQTSTYDLNMSPLLGNLFFQFHF